MGKVIVAGCFCPLWGMLDFFPEGAVWIPTAGGYLGDHEEVAQRIGLIPGHRNDDLIFVTSHAPCPSNSDDVEAHAFTESYVETLLHAGKHAVGIFLGKSMTLFNPGGETDLLIHEVFYNISDERRFLRRKEEKIDPSKIRKVRIAPFFVKDGHIQEGVIHISTLFSMKRAVDLLREWGDGAFPPRYYNSVFDESSIKALEAQFA